MNYKKLIESSNIEHYLSDKFSAYNVDIYSTDKYIIIEIPHMYNIKKSMDRLILSVDKDGNNIKIVNTKTNYIDSVLTIGKEKYIIRMVKSDLDF